MVLNFSILSSASERYDGNRMSRRNDIVMRLLLVAWSTKTFITSINSHSKALHTPVRSARCRFQRLVCFFCHSVWWRARQNGGNLVLVMRSLLLLAKRDVALPCWFPWASRTVWASRAGSALTAFWMFWKMPVKWVLEQQYAFLRALFFVMMDLTSEVSSGAVDLAKEILQVKYCCSAFCFCWADVIPAGVSLPLSSRCDDWLCPRLTTNH